MYGVGMGNSRRNHPTIQVTARDQATSRPARGLEDLDDDELDVYFWGPLKDPKGTYVHHFESD